MKNYIFILSATIALNVSVATANQPVLIPLSSNTVFKFLKDDDPAKLAKKQAKKLKKEGWTVTVGHPDIETQLIKAAEFENETITDEKGRTINRYIIQTAIQTARTYNAAYASARTAAQAEVAAVLKTRIKGAMRKTIDSEQTSRINASTIDAFNEKAEAIVDETLKNSRPVIDIYRNLPNQAVEVQLRLVFDRTEIVDDIKSNMIQQLNVTPGGNDDKILCGLVEESVNQMF